LVVADGTACSFSSSTAACSVIISASAGASCTEVTLPDHVAQPSCLGTAFFAAAVAGTSAALLPATAPALSSSVSAGSTVGPLATTAWLPTTAPSLSWSVSAGSTCGSLATTALLPATAPALSSSVSAGSTVGPLATTACSVFPLSPAASSSSSPSPFAASSASSALPLGKA